jgi:hypothetical protein
VGRRASSRAGWRDREEHDRLRGEDRLCVLDALAIGLREAIGDPDRVSLQKSMPSLSPRRV